MSDINNSSPAIPKAMADLEWVWVLTTPMTKERDLIYVVEMKEASGDIRRIVPVFETREDAEQLKDKLVLEKNKIYTAQSMRLAEVGNFAAKNEVEIMLLDVDGTILAHMEAKLEQVALH